MYTGSEFKEFIPGNYYTFSNQIDVKDRTEITFNLINDKKFIEEFKKNEYIGLIELNDSFLTDSYNLIGKLSVKIL